MSIAKPAENPKTPTVADVKRKLTLAAQMQALSSSEAGLSTAEAGARLIRFGPNHATDTRRESLWLQFLKRFQSPLVLLLLFASALSAITGDMASFVIIITMVVLSLVLDFVQDVRAENAVEALRSSVALKANVWRDGAMVSLDFKTLVPGDVVMLSPGDLVPADARLISSQDLFVNQALLTGESFPVEKKAGEGDADAPEATTADNRVFMGSSVISGSARAVLTETGGATQLGGLAHSLSLTPPPTAFERGVKDFGFLILKLTFIMVSCVLLINLMLHRPWLESFLFALALAVGLTPELLPMMMTITLSRGAIRMAQKRVIVKHLPAMHNLGAMTILCTDKTGTLTEANITLQGAFDSLGAPCLRAYEMAWLNAHFESGIKSPLDQAIIGTGDDAVSNAPQGLTPPDPALWRKLDEVPFDFERRRISVVIEDDKERLLVVKGAPEDILALSSHFSNADGACHEITDRDALSAQLQAYGEQGFRVLGVATKALRPDQSDIDAREETDLQLVGFLTFMDPPKLSAKSALQSLSEAGVRVKIISGDNAHITRHVCEILGVSGDVLNGGDIDKLSDEALISRLNDAAIFCRVTPQQKSRLIAMLKRRGETVGFMGDGINDAAALRVADVGISVNTATDVAKQAADIILLDADLSVVHDAVMEGRRAVVNTEKYILMGSSSNFGNMFSMAGAAIFLPFLPMLPIQILLNNLLYDVSQIALPFDNVDPEALIKPINWDMGRIKRFMMILGPVSSVFDFVTFYALLTLFRANETAFHTGWFVESLLTQVMIVFAIRTRRPLWRSKPHIFVASLTLGIVAVTLLLPFTPVGQWFHLAPPSPVFFAFLAAILCAYFAVVETVKQLARRWI